MIQSRTLHDSERRYPGAHFFEDDDVHRLLFHGRDQDKYELLQLILAERLVVLFARPGIGKSSIINAGLLQPLRNRAFFPMVVRVNSATDNPMDSLYKGVEAACGFALEKGEIESYEPGSPAEWNRVSFWHFFKSFYIWRVDRDEPLEPVIIFDQFEELFTTISKASRRSFIDELADLVRGTPPKDWSKHQGTEPDLGDQPPRVKVLLSLREDFIAHLQEMAIRNPGDFQDAFPAWSSEKRGRQACDRRARRAYQRQDRNTSLHLVR